MGALVWNRTPAGRLGDVQSDAEAFAKLIAICINNGGTWTPGPFGVGGVCQAGDGSGGSGHTTSAAEQRSRARAACLKSGGVWDSDAEACQSGPGDQLSCANAGMIWQQSAVGGWECVPRPNNETACDMAGGLWQKNSSGEWQCVSKTAGDGNGVDVPQEGVSSGSSTGGGTGVVVAAAEVALVVLIAVAVL